MFARKLDLKMCLKSFLDLMFTIMSSSKSTQARVSDIIIEHFFFTIDCLVHFHTRSLVFFYFGKIDKKLLSYPIQPHGNNEKSTMFVQINTIDK